MVPDLARKVGTLEAHEKVQRRLLQGRHRRTCRSSSLATSSHRTTGGASVPIRGEPMKPEPIRDGGRQRCTQCGHPRKEHKDVESCSVPKCRCTGHKLAAASAPRKAE